MAPPLTQLIDLTRPNSTPQKIVGGAKFLYSFGCCCAYVVVIRKNLGSGLINISSCGSSLCKTVFNDEVFCSIVCLLLVLPLSLKRNLDSLSKFSFISVCCVILIGEMLRGAKRLR